MLYKSIGLLNNNDEGIKESTISYVYLSNFYIAIKDTLKSQLFAEKALNEKFENGPYNFNSIPSILKAIEAYNGFGYTTDSININAPYLWSGTDKYTSGKFTSDNHYEADATDKQMGAVPIIKELQKLGVKIP